MAPLAQSNLQHGQDIFSSESEHVEIPFDHVEHIQQGVWHLPQSFQLTS